MPGIMPEEPHSHIEQETQSDLIERCRRLARQGMEGRRQARQLLEEQLRLHPEAYEPLDLEAEVLAQDRNLVLAQQLLEEYTRYFSENADARARLAWIHRERGNQDEALAEIRATVACHPENFRARQWLVEWALEWKNYLVAAEAAEEGIRRFPDERTFHLALARAAANLDDDQRARHAYQTLLGIDPSNEEAAQSYAGYLLSQNEPREARRVLEQFIPRPDARPKTHMRYAAAAFRTGDNQTAVDHIRRVVTDQELEDEKTAHDAVALVLQNMGEGGGGKFLLGLLESRDLADLAGVDFLERTGQTGKKQQIANIFHAAAEAPLAYPRTITRFLSTFHDSLRSASPVHEWIARHRQEIQSNTRLWGGVGAWYVQREKWHEAIAHLSTLRDRPDAQQWMALLLGRAYEGTGNRAAANEVYRNALAMEPDHSEASVRSRLAFNMAMEDMPGAGRLIVMDCTERGKRLASPEDLVRLFAVEALAEAVQTPDREECQSLFAKTLERMQQLAGDDSASDVTRLIKVFQRKTSEILSRGR